MDKSTRPARLFTFAAAGFVVLGPLLEMVRHKPSIDIYFHDGYFAIPNWMATLIAAAICGMFALLYFGCGRLLRIPLNRGLSLANFLLIVLPLGTLIFELHSIHPNLESGLDSWAIKFVLITYIAWMICFIVGCMLFVLNFSWTLVRVARTRA